MLQFAFMVSPMNAEVELSRVAFDYSVGGKQLASISFLPCNAVDLPAVGDAVAVEYVVAAPHRARVAGWAYHAYGWQVVWTFFFPLIGLALVFPRLWATPGQVELLRIGQIAYGTLANKQGAHDVGGFKVLEFEFRAAATPGMDVKPPIPDRPAKAADGSYLPLEDEGAGVYKVWLIELATKSVEDELWEPVLYLPRDPNVACLLDALDVVPADEEDWEQQAWVPKRRMFFVYLVLARPLSVLLVNVIAAHMFASWQL